jgi:hypothetical protein
MKFIQTQEGVFINIEAIAEASFSEVGKQQHVHNPDVNAPCRSKRAPCESATIKLVNGSQHVLTGELAELLRTAIENSRIN